MTKPTTFVLVRHGETEGNSSIRYHGVTDVLLSDLGRAQMRATRAALQQHIAGDPAPIFASPLLRAIESARLLASKTADLTPIEEFREINFGLFEGLTAEEIRDRHPAEHRRWMQARFAPDFTFPGGENRREFTARVARGLERMLALCGDATGAYVLLVAHRGVIRTIVNQLTGAEPLVELGSIQILQGDSAWRAEHLDLIDHLRGI